MRAGSALFVIFATNACFIWLHANTVHANALSLCMDTYFDNLICVS